MPKTRAIARARGHFQREKGSINRLDANFHDEIELASLKARNAIFSPKINNSAVTHSRVDAKRAGPPSSTDNIILISGLITEGLTG